MSFRDSVTNNFFVKKFYSTLFYFEQGKGQVNRFYAEIPNFIIILGGLKYLFNISFSPLVYVLIFFACYVVFTILGYFFKHSGLYDVDRITQANKDPVMCEVYNAARRINEKR